jgi:hypothetical protein
VAGGLNCCFGCMGGFSECGLSVWIAALLVACDAISWLWAACVRRYDEGTR